MDCPDISIRAASPADAEELLAVYAPYVRKTAITFEYDVPCPGDFRARMEHTLKRYPWLKAVGGGEILGYAYTGAFVGRAAYDWAAETSIYVREDKKGTGIGKKLYLALESVSRAQHITNLNACIGVPQTEDEYLTKNSAQFHAHLGYSAVGEFHSCGYKFGRWYNMVWMEKIIGPHAANPLPLIPFPALSAEALSAAGVDAE